MLHPKISGITRLTRAWVCVWVQVLAREQGGSFKISRQIALYGAFGCSVGKLSRLTFKRVLGALQREISSVL